MMNERNSGRAFPSPEHDHAPCVESMMGRTKAAFASRGLQLTPLRRRVLEEIASSHHAVGAYDLLERLARKGERRLAPISVYRALDALVAAGVVHRLESRNAFFACHASHPADRRQIILACERCGVVAEVSGERAFDGIADAAGSAGFETSRALVELTGCCARCAAEAPSKG
jgi:Fur family transcriptional regulator, zinc uptake regulator